MSSHVDRVRLKAIEYSPEIRKMIECGYLRPLVYFQSV